MAKASSSVSKPPGKKQAMKWLTSVMSVIFTELNCSRWRLYPCQRDSWYNYRQRAKVKESTVNVSSAKDIVTFVIMIDSKKLPLSQRENLQSATCAPGTSLKAFGVCTSAIPPPEF